MKKDILKTVKNSVLGDDGLFSGEQFENARKEETKKLKNLQKAWKKWPAKDEISEYIVPSTAGSGSTTGCAINLRHGKIFHFWIRYKSEDALQADLDNIVELLAGKEEDDTQENDKVDRDKEMGLYERLTGECRGRCECKGSKEERGGERRQLVV